jgi:hypothetical protein
MSLPNNIKLKKTNKNTDENKFIDVQYEKNCGNKIEGIFTFHANTRTHINKLAINKNHHSKTPTQFKSG